MQKLYEESNIQAIADAIRSKNGKQDTYKTSEMADAIEALEGKDPNCNGMHIPEEALVITGDCQYKFSSNGWNWFIEQCGDRISTKDITSASNMFYFADELEEIPFDINMKEGKTPSINAIFQQCSELESVPYVKGVAGNINSLFDNCRKLRNIPDDWGDYLDTSYVANNTFGNMSAVFNNCNSLRKAPKSLLSKLHGKTTSTIYVSYRMMFSGCFVLDEIKGIPIHNAALTSNTFSDSFYRCFRASDVMFEAQEDGAPYSATWKSQTIDLTSTGFVLSGQKTYIFLYNSGIATDKEVVDDASYQALKDDPDWFTCNEAYSRYNKISAVNTINSLPDVSAGSGNTIKFKGAAGSATDGGAINTLTAEEIAVAASKGWTVSMA